MELWCSLRVRYPTFHLYVMFNRAMCIITKSEIPLCPASNIPARPVTMRPFGNTGGPFSFDLGGGVFAAWDLRIVAN
jgi:hypothetical protein